MSVKKAAAWGLAMAFAATVAVLLIGFLGRVSINFPGVLELNSTAQGAPQTE